MVARPDADEVAVVEVVQIVIREADHTRKYVLYISFPAIPNFKKIFEIKLLSVLNREFRVTQTRKVHIMDRH